MKKFIIIFLLLSVTLTAKTFMWKVLGGKSDMYILGSIHVASPKLYPLNHKITEAYDKSENLVVEVNITKVGYLQQMQMASLGMYKDKTLKDVLPKDLYEKLSKKLAELSYPIFVFNKMKPWMASLSLTMLQMKKMGYDSNYGIDLYFLKNANSEKKNVLELETAEFQMNLLAGFDEKLDILNLKLLLDNWDENTKMMKKLFNDWKIGNIKTLEEISYKDVDKYPQLKVYYKKILIDRNKKMAEKLDKFLKGKKTSYFVIVGGGHLVGKEGIIEILRKKGYKLIQQ